MAYEIQLQKEILDAITAIANPSWWDSPSAIIIWSGLMTALGASITYFINNRLEANKMQSEINLRQVDLDNARKENLLNEQKDALKELSILSHDVRPTIWSSPDYDSYQAYSDVVSSMWSFLQKLDKYLGSYRYLLPKEVLDALEDVMFTCNMRHWNASLEMEYQPTENDIEAAKDVLEKMSVAEELLRKLLKIT